jgi:predicted lipid-binding transport protein (Tim44 family)
MFNPFSAFFAIFGIAAFLIIAGAIAMIVIVITAITRAQPGSRGNSLSRNRSYADEPTVFPTADSMHQAGVNPTHIPSTPIIGESTTTEFPHTHSHEVHSHHHTHDVNAGTSAIVDAVGMGLGAGAGIEIGAAIDASTQAWNTPDSSSQPTSFDPGPTFTDNSASYSAPVDTSSMSTPSVDTSSMSSF